MERCTPAVKPGPTPRLQPACNEGKTTAKMGHMIYKILTAEQLKTFLPREIIEPLLAKYRVG